MLFCNMIVPAITILAGWFMWKHSPKEINSIIGYRTKRSMKNDGPTGTFSLEASSLAKK